MLTLPAHNAALIQKQFVLNFITFYMPLLFTAFVYIPFSHVLEPFLDFWRKTAQIVTFSEKPLPTKQLQMDPRRIGNQMFGLTVTGQVINLGMEVVLPWATRLATRKAKQLQHKEDPAAKDHPEETDLMARVRHECGLDVYDVSVDYREMVIQFGKYTSLWRAFPYDSDQSNQYRLPVHVLGGMASGARVLHHQQLGGAAVRRLQDCRGQPPTDPVAV